MYVWAEWVYDLLAYAIIILYLLMRPSSSGHLVCPCKGCTSSKLKPRPSVVILLPPPFKYYYYLGHCILPRLPSLTSVDSFSFSRPTNVIANTSLCRHYVFFIHPMLAWTKKMYCWSNIHKFHQHFLPTTDTVAMIA